MAMSIVNTPLHLGQNKQNWSNDDFPACYDTLIMGIFILSAAGASKNVPVVLSDLNVFTKNWGGVHNLGEAKN